jgi:hypothetical protein
MICFAKPGLREDLYILQRRSLSNTLYMYEYMRSLFIREKTIFSSERIFRKDFEGKGLVEKNS